MNTRGIHITADFWGIPDNIINDTELLWESMKEAARLANMTIVGELPVSFEPHGFTGVLVLAESHLSIHTYPEEGFIAVDAYTCGACEPTKAIKHLVSKWSPEEVRMKEVYRGIRSM